MDISELTKLPLSYRQEVVSPIMQDILAGESCSIVGIAGTGKSNLMRLLARPDVRSRYLGTQQDKFFFFFVDFNRLAEHSAWGFWELLLHRVVATLSEAKAEPNLLAQLTALHQQATISRDELVAQRCFETCVGILCTHPNRRLVFLFDQFDSAWKSLKDAPFLILRSLRDEFKYRLSFIVATRDELSWLREDLEGCQDFYELVSLNTYGLGPHSEEDARNQVERFAIRRGQTIGEREIEQLMELTGRHPGILKTAYWALAEGKVVAGEGLAEQLAQDTMARGGCEEIWKSLAEDERVVLMALATGRAPSASDQEVIQLLKIKSLVTGDASRPFCELFERYIKQLTPSGPRHLLLKESGLVIVEGKPVAAELSQMELLLLSHLYERRGEVCERQEIIQALYPDETQIDEDGLYDDRRLDTIVRRLRDKIEPDRNNPRYILTVRKRGYKLAPDEVKEGSS